MTISEDAFLWLEDIHSKEALDWVRKQNQRTLGRLQSYPQYQSLEQELRAIHFAEDRIALPELRGKWLYNFWQDEKHVRGIWRRTSEREYRKREPKWETVLDLDDLARVENENWVWHGAETLPPDHKRCLLHLSRGGKDAAVVREFDAVRRTFVKDGFEIPEAKTQTCWVNRNTLIVGTDFGPGTMTRSGYPRRLAIWKRGTPLSKVKPIFEALETDVAARATTVFRPDGITTFIERRIQFYEQEYWIVSRGRKVHVPIPPDSEIVDVFRERLLVLLRSAWKPGTQMFRAGSLVAVPARSLNLAATTVLMQPDSRTSIESVVAARDWVGVKILRDVKARLLRFQPGRKEKWTRRQISFPAVGNLTLAAFDAYRNESYISYESFLQPTTLYRVDGRGNRTIIRKLPRRFDAARMQAQQFFAKSEDGTEIPYFVIRRQSGKKAIPAILYGYGGFEISLTPAYLGSTGKAWLERDGAYIIANIRGGGEYGPRWHQAALLENRHKSYEDFIAVARDVIDRGITAPEKLGIVGGSNGGLLVGAVMIREPALFAAVACHVPLLDMLRYHKLLAGASWIGEYGNPEDSRTRDVLMRYSPYQNLRRGANYPEIIFLGSTADDRVHPGHARKMAARMESLQMPFLFYENIEGGHGAAANIEQRVRLLSLQYTYFLQKLFR